MAGDGHRLRRESSSMLASLPARRPAIPPTTTSPNLSRPRLRRSYWHRNFVDAAHGALRAVAHFPKSPFHRQHNAAKNSGTSHTEHTNLHHNIGNYTNKYPKTTEN